MAAAALIAVILSAVAVASLDWQYRESSVLRGDFPAFYAAASIVWSGKLSLLYVPAIQRTLENRYWPSLAGNYLYFTYPPFFALALAPLAIFPPLLAKLIFQLSSALFAIWALCKVPDLEGRLTLFLTALFLFPPVTSAFFAGQNVLLSIGLYALSFTLIGRGTTRDDFRAGLLLGLWCFKPNLALIVLAVILFARRLVVLLGALLTGVLLWSMTTLAFGPGWMRAWQNALRFFASEDLRTNGYQMISLSGFLHSALGPEFHEGGLVASTVLLAALLLYAFIGSSKRESVMHALLLAAPAALLISPHTLYYDLGLLLLPLAYVLRGLTEREIALLLALWGVVFAVTARKEDFFAQPLCALLVTALCLLVLTPRKKLGFTAIV